MYNSVHSNVQTRSSFRSAITPTHFAHHITRISRPVRLVLSLNTTWWQHRCASREKLAESRGGGRSEGGKATVCSRYRSDPANRYAELEGGHRAYPIERPFDTARPRAPNQSPVWRATLHLGNANGILIGIPTNARLCSRPRESLDPCQLSPISLAIDDIP